jgi:type II secretory pathway component PulM
VEGEEPSNLTTSDDDKNGDAEAKPDATKADAKGGKTCSNCGKGHDADSKLRNCAGCGHDLPHAGTPSSEKGDGAEGVEGAEPPVKKSKASCPKCAAKCGMKSAFCKKCGAAMKGEGMKPEDENVEKGKPVPGAGVVGTGAAAVEPVPAHREPDGAAIEALEGDAGLPTTADASVKAAQRVKTVGAPADLGSLHDLTCPAFDPAVVKNAYPSDTFAGLDDMAWQQKALDAAANAPLEEAGKMTQLWQHVSTLKAADATMLDEVRADVYKSFQDANPGPGSFPTPMELSPVRFRRPLITSGQAEESPGHDGPNTAKVPTDHIEAGDFERGALTTGQAAQSPSNKGRTFYRNVQRDAALQAMAALHDHIAQTFPDLCTVHENTGGPGIDPNPLPNPVGKAETTPVESKVETAVEVEKVDDTVVKAAGVSAELIKSAVVDALTPLAEQIETLTKALTVEQAKNAKLAETVEELSNLADPTVTAFKGVASPDALKSSTPVASTVASAAERTQAALLAVLTEQARNSPDPSEREAAWAEVYKMSGIG